MQLRDGPQRAAPPAGSVPLQLRAEPRRAALPPGPPASPRSSADSAARSGPVAAAPRLENRPPPAGPCAAAGRPPGPGDEADGHVQIRTTAIQCSRLPECLGVLDKRQEGQKTTPKVEQFGTSPDLSETQVYIRNLKDTFQTSIKHL